MFFEEIAIVEKDIVGEPDDGVAQFSQACLALLVFLEDLSLAVNSTINFDDQLGFMTIEIHGVVLNRRLSTKLEAV